MEIETSATHVTHESMRKFNLPGIALSSYLLLTVAAQAQCKTPAETPGAECLLHYMDQANIPKAVIYGLPVAKQFGAAERAVPRYYMDNDAPCYYYGLFCAVFCRPV